MREPGKSAKPCDFTSYGSRAQRAGRGPASARRSGTYYHNVLGRVELHPDDPAADEAKSAALWDLVENLCLPTQNRQAAQDEQKDIEEAGL